MTTATRLRLRTGFESFDKRVYILGLGWLVTAAGFAMVIPFMSIYFHQELGMSMSAIGLFFGFSAILRSVPQPFAGWLSDRIGRVPIMGWSQILRALTFTGVGYAIMNDAGFYAIAAIISFNYITGAVLHPAANAMVADLVRKEQRISAFALLRIAGNLGWAVGPALGGFIAHRSYALLFYVAGVVALLSGVFFLLALRDMPRRERDSEANFRLTDIFNLRKDPKLYRHCLISLLLFLAVAQLIATLSVYSVDSIGITRSQLGMLYGINGLMVVLLQYPVSSILKKMRLTRQLALGGAVYAVGYFMVGLAPGYMFLIVCMVIITTAEMIVSPPSLTLVANLSTPGKHGLYMGVFGLFQTAGWSLGPMVGGAILDTFMSEPLIMWSSIALMATVSSWFYISFGRTLAAEIDSGRGSKESVAAHG